MPKFLATTQLGLRDVLVEELQELGMKKIEPIDNGAYFETNWKGCYKVNYESRIASRILLPILDFPAYQPEELYQNILKHDYTKYLAEGGTIKVDATVRNSDIWKDQRFVAMKVKDAVVDQFQEAFGMRPDVNRDNPDLCLMVRVVQNYVNVSIDTTGSPLFQRSYRQVSEHASLKENLAAGILKIMKWDGVTPIYDPMCGAGTFLTEAGLLHQKVAPGSLRRGFAFQTWLTFQEDAWQEVLDEAHSREIEGDITLWGSDINPIAIQHAKKNAQKAGVDNLIQWKILDVLESKPPVEKGILLMNPPYGERMGFDEDLKMLFSRLGETLKKNYAGWDVWLLSGNAEYTSGLGMKAERKYVLKNGDIDCRLLHYKVHARNS